MLGELEIDWNILLMLPFQVSVCAWLSEKVMICVCAVLLVISPGMKIQ